MRRGAFNTILKLSGSVLNRGHMEKEIRKNYALRSQESNQCSLFSTILKALFTKNLFNLVKLLMLYFILVYWSVCLAVLEVFGMNIVIHVDGDCCTIMHLLILRPLFRIIWPNIIFLWSIILRIHLIWHPATISCSQQCIRRRKEFGLHRWKIFKVRRRSF